MNDETIERRVNARASADELMDFAIDESKPLGAEARVFWERLQSQIAALINIEPPRPKVDKAKPMGEQEASEWEEKTEMAFGKHKGEKVRDVPIDYLLWLDETNEFGRQLTRYLGSPLAQREQPEPFEYD